MKASLLPKALSTLVAMMLLFAFTSLNAQKYVYEDAWANPGFNLTQSSNTGLEITFSVDEFSLTDFDLKGEAMKEIQVIGNFLPNNEGAPNLPGNGRYIAIPNGATATYTITAQRTETYKNVNIAPSPRIPKVTDSGPLHYEKNMRIYSRDAFYPANPVSLSEKTNIRGVEAVILGITPFQYNPVSKELIVYHDLKVEVSFEGGNNTFGEDRLRSRWFDPLLNDMMINYDIMANVQYPSHAPESATPDFEYVIIIPDDPIFLSWAEELALFRNQQGIRTGIFTTTEVGGNTTVAIESFVDDAYANWAVAPVAVLLIGDYGTSGNTIVSPIWDSYCASDNIYADVSGNDMPDVIFARMTAQNETHLETMITKVINYETDPPTNPDFYDHPITALGWQTERWFQICSESVGGYFKNVHGKTPVRINAVYSGNPSSDPWSTATNTSTVVDYFGPDGLGYIPATPGSLGGWTGGNSSMVVNSINDGAFLLQHRDHGYELGWGEPDFNNSNISSLTNTDLTFIFSINCLTGKYNYGSECFAEKFHRHTYNGQNAGALGIIAASEISYSFVNDTYVWGMYDNMWPDFMPDYQTDPMPRGLLPAFGNAGGKYFLQQSSWPYNTSNKEVTYNLFHHHGGAFSTLYSEVPMDLTVSHDNVVLAGLDLFNITADDGAFIALSVDGEIIGTGTATGSTISITIAPQTPPTVVDVVVTKTNYNRYHAQVDVIPPDGPYIVQNDITINDEAGNNNGEMDYGESILLTLEVKNVGSDPGENIEVTVTTEDDHITMTQSQASYGLIPAGGLKSVDDAFAFDVDGSIPDLHTVIFDVEATDGTDIWESSFFLKGHAPNLSFVEVIIDDAAGNGNGRLDPGETADLLISVSNSGTADGYEVIGDLLCADPNVTINTASMDYGDIVSGDIGTQSYNVTTSVITPAGYSLDFTLDLEAFGGVAAQGLFSLTVGQMPILIIDLDKTPQNSGPHMKTAIQDLGIGVEYTQSWPDDMGMYANLFVCLGIYSNNHVLTANQGQELADFLNDGGNVYMEGGDTWYYDAVTAVHPMFKINKIADGSGDLNVLNGQAGSFTEGMSFNYGGDNNYIDHIAAISPAFEIFENNSPAYFAGVAYHAGDYRTIGCSFEFGGLANGSGVNTKMELMERYLNFFGIRKVTEAPGMPGGDDEVCAASNVPYITNSVDGADFYYWIIEPEEAGLVNGSDTAVSIDWSGDYTGAAYVKVCGMNNTGIGPQSDSLMVMVNAAPSATMTGSASVCSGADVELSVALTGIAPWTLEIDNQTYNADTSPFTLIVNPTSSTTYAVTSVADAGGCDNVGTGATQVDIIPDPDQAAAPTGPAFVNSDDNPTSVYSTTGATNADNYGWMITPSTAYTDMAVIGMDVTITWDNSYKGDVGVQVRGLNGECPGEYSDEITVTLESSYGIDELARTLGLAVYPNPNKGSFTLELATEAVDKVNVRIVNAIGHTVYQEQDLRVSSNFSKIIDISREAEGIYMMVVESDLGIYTSRILIQK
ncbi:MAG: C25 family cysteine peptidase [Bacteroidota bacterium]